jgi:hypothetical protein
MSFIGRRPGYKWVRDKKTQEDRGNTKTWRKEKLVFNALTAIVYNGLFAYFREDALAPHTDI